MDSIFIDFDGVIRIWDGSEVHEAEESTGLVPGTLYAVAFESSLLGLAITGEISHEEWVDRVQSALSSEHGPQVSNRLISAWSAASFTINHQFLKELREASNGAKLVLVTNATSKLSADIKQSSLSQSFDKVVNSSVIGVAKPDSSFYKKAVSLAGATIGNSLFIDDSAKNVEAAKTLGLRSQLHKSPAETLAFVNKHCS